jgi:hypothetical protein
MSLPSWAVYWTSSESIRPPKKIDECYIEKKFRPKWNVSHGAPDYDIGDVKAFLFTFHEGFDGHYTHLGLQVWELFAQHISSWFFHSQYTSSYRVRRIASRARIRRDFKEDIFSCIQVLAKVSYPDEIW